MSSTQNKTIVPLAEDTRMCVAAAQWLLEDSKANDPPKYKCNSLETFICGEEAFAKIAQDIKKAKASVEIICWGFDPAMELTRHGSTWPRGDTWGGLLKDVAAGKYNGGKPVQVRVLSWYGFIGSKLAGNMPGAGSDASYERKNAASRSAMALFLMGGAHKLPPPPPPTTPQDKREVFNATWYREAFNGDLKNIAIRTRDGDSAAVEKSLQSEPGKRGFIETLGMEHLATDHQKTILIDYEHEGGAHAVGYVMGLNSVTDYWDTKQHLFHDPRRGAPWEGDGNDLPSLKPYQDYACRIQGEALVAVSKNFTDAWNRARCNGRGCGAPLKRTHDLKNPPAGLTDNIQCTAHQAQIVRTQPEETEKTIGRLYRQASSFAREYIYIENQYFQNTEWAKQLKADRKAFVEGWQKCRRSPSQLPTLHVMVVMPTPELGLMVPRTYDTVKTLGHADSMPQQDRMIEHELKAHYEWEAYASSARAKGEIPSPYKYPGPLSPLAQSAWDAGHKKNLAKELATLGMRTLVGSLWTFNHDWRSAQREELAELKKFEGEGMWQKQQREYRLDRINKARFREIYIHSKLMVIDDSMFTLGSANLNLRSMAVDAELNIASDNEQCSIDLRRRVWDLHTGGAEFCNPTSGEPESVAKAFKAWGDLMKTNDIAKTKSDDPKGFIYSFEDKRTSSSRLG